MEIRRLIVGRENKESWTKISEANDTKKITSVKTKRLTIPGTDWKSVSDIGDVNP